MASFIAKHTYQMFKLQSETRGEQTALIDEMIGGQKVVQAYCYEDERLKDLMKLMTVCRNVHSKPFFIHRLPIRLPVLSTALYMRGLR